MGQKLAWLLPSTLFSPSTEADRMGGTQHPKPLSLPAPVTEFEGHSCPFKILPLQGLVC
jgi:hypothetical protein